LQYTFNFPPRTLGWPRKVISGLFLWRRNRNFSANSPCSQAEERRVYQNFCREIL